MAENNLIHAGLPWTNPAKITIKSSEFINDVTINRGLLNLLNNDYYLDLKTEAINEYLETTVQDHINNGDIHFSWDDVKDLFDRIACLSANTGYRIPIRKPGTGDMITTAEIMEIVNKIPRNLNGYVLVLELCVPLSAASKETTGYKISINGSGTAPGGKYGYNFNNRSLNIEDFFGGTLLIWANNQYFVDDITNPNVFDEEIPGGELSNIISHLQTQMITPKTSSQITSTVGSMIPLSGTAINSRYSVMSLRNLLCDTYVYNMNITNTLSSTNNIEDIVAEMEFPEYDDVICMWPLRNNTECKYENESILGEMTKPKFTPVINSVRDPQTLFGVTDSVSCATFNLTNFTEGDQPDHLIFDNTFNTEAQKPISNLVRNILYETNTSNNITLMFWANLTDYNTHSPLLVDGNINTDEHRTKGLYLYLDQFLIADPAYPDKAAYQSSHQEYFNDKTNDPSNSYYNRWSLYVLEFQHTNTTLADREPYKKAFYRNIENGYTRLNMTVYWNKSTTKTGVKPDTRLLLYPNLTTYESATSATDLINAGLQFKMNGLYSSNNVLRFFANQIIPSKNDSTTSISYFDFFSGSVRNMLLFNKFLSLKEIYAIFEQGPGTMAYDWYDIGEYDIIKTLSKNNYFGTVYAHNVKQLNMINNNFIQKLK